MRRGDEPVGEAGGGDAADAGDRLAAGLLDQIDDFGRRRLVQVIDDDARAFAGQLERQSAADAASGAGDERDLVLKLWTWVSCFLIGVRPER